MNRLFTAVCVVLVCLVGAAFANPVESVPVQTISSAPDFCPVAPPEDVGCAAEEVGCGAAAGPVRRLGARLGDRVRNGIDRRQGRRQARRERRHARGGVFGCR